MAYRNRRFSLNQRTHWRRFKRMAKEIGEYEKINMDSYDLDNTTCYSTYGEGMNGSYVAYSTNDGSSCFSDSKEYEMYEVPKKVNSSEFTFEGDFLLYSHNAEDDYWMLSELSDSIDYKNTIKTKTIVENVHIKPIGRYDVISDSETGGLYVRKTHFGYYLSYSCIDRAKKFDEDGIRKHAFSKMSKSEILRKVLKRRKYANIVSKNKVKVYKKKKKK